MGGFVIGLIGAVGLLGTLAAVAGGSGSRGASGHGGVPVVGNARLDTLRGMAQAAQIPASWIDFLAFVAYGESRWNSSAANRTDSEAAAAVKAFGHNRSRFSGCNADEAEYGFGSGGWFGFLPAVGLAQLPPHLRCLGPQAVFDPAASLAMAVGFAQGLMDWNGFSKVRTWLNLRAGWGWPAKMGDVAYLESKRSKYETHAAKTGLSPAWLDGAPPPLSVTPAQVYQRLTEAT